MIDRDKARLRIIQAANRRRYRTGSHKVLGFFSERHLQRCVAICRNNRLVKPDVLKAAGFNEHGPNYRPGRPA